MAAAPFKPSFSTKVNSFVPSKPFTPSQPATVPVKATTFQAPPPKPVEPKKEKSVLILERIVTGSEEDVKNDAISADDLPLINKMKDTVTEISTKKLTVALLRTFIAQVKSVAKLPSNLVKTSVHGRLIERSDKGEEKHLVDNKRLNRPTGHGYGDSAGEYRGRGGGRGRGRGDYNGNREDRGDRHGHGRGRGGDRQGFNTRAPQPEVLHTEEWRKE